MVERRTWRRATRLDSPGNTVVVRAVVVVVVVVVVGGGPGEGGPG